MGVLSVAKTQAAASGSVSKTGRKYTAPYLVTVEYATDGPVTILNYFRLYGPWVGDFFSYGNETDTTVKCTGITPQRVANSVKQWTVVATYEEPDKQEDKEDDDGNSTDTPADWRMTIQGQTATFSVPAWAAWNVDAIPLSGTSSFTRTADTYGPVVNSVGVVLDPPLMRQSNEYILRVTGYRDAYVEAWIEGYLDTINASQLYWSPRLKTYYGFSGDVFEKYEVKCTSAGAIARWWRNIVYYEYSYELRIRRRSTGVDDPVDGWLESVLDRGISRRAGAGDPDGSGGTISAGDLEDGMSRTSPILDVTGRRVPELILLDGAGQPATGAAERTGVYIRWRVNATENLTGLPLPIFA